MRLPQLFSPRRQPRHPVVPLASTVVRLADADPVRRPTSTTIERPDEYVALALPNSAEPPAADAERESVLAGIRAALAGGCLDEYTADARDAHIDARRAGWDIAVRSLGPDRLRTELRLAAQELEYLAQAQKRVQQHQVAVTRLEGVVEDWRQVLLGHRTTAPGGVGEGTRGTDALPSTAESFIAGSVLHRLLDDLPVPVGRRTPAVSLVSEVPVTGADYRDDWAATPAHLSVITTPTVPEADIDSAEEFTP